MTQTKQYGSWEISFDASDGGRIESLSYEGVPLLTVRKEEIRLPLGDYGQYETRPAYGYDDCFPTVDPALYPQTTWEIPDHGELCWLPWEVEEMEKGLLFSVKSRFLPVRFNRILNFSSDRLTWRFEVLHFGDQPLPFQHVMHALLPLGQVKDIYLPSFTTAWDDIHQEKMPFSSPEEMKKFLLSSPEGTYYMIFLRDIEEGRVSWQYQEGLKVDMIFDKTRFPSVGIWWNRQGYPDEDHARRNECAFEPTPGYNSNLADPLNERVLLEARPEASVEWSIYWNIHKT